MPENKGEDKSGHFWRWGKCKKYYFKSNNPVSEGIAKYKAKKQGRAIKARGR